MRPSIAVDGGAMRSEDDLTYKLGEIIKASANVRKSEQEGSPAHIITEFEQLLQVRLPLLPLFIGPTCVRLLACSPMFAVPRRDVHGQRHRRHPAGAAKVRTTRQSHPRALEG